MVWSAAALALPASCTSTAAPTVPSVVLLRCSSSSSQHALALSSPHLRSTLTVALAPNAPSSARSTAACTAGHDKASSLAASAQSPRNDAERRRTGPATGGPPPRQTKPGGHGWQKTAGSEEERMNMRAPHGWYSWSS
eukprot:496688-Rhodomonas_salina.1